jgi:hypothetical protein
MRSPIDRRSTGSTKQVTPTPDESRLIALTPGQGSAPGEFDERPSPVQGPDRQIERVEAGGQNFGGGFGGPKFAGSPAPTPGRKAHHGQLHPVHAVEEPGRGLGGDLVTGRIHHADRVAGIPERCHDPGAHGSRPSDHER